MDIFKNKEALLENISKKVLKKANKKICQDSIIRESGRIERIAESFFVQAKAQEYNEFIINWLLKNERDIIIGEKFSYDVNISDESYENNVENYFR